MPRKEKKYHYIYKTTCSLTKRFYFGMHSTDNLDDGYLGSGKILKRSIIKNGSQNHNCEILEFLNNRDLLKIREREIVNESLLQNTFCMNLMVGGDGGFISEEQQLRRAKIATSIFQEKMKNDPEFRKSFTKKVSESAKRQHKEGKGVIPDWTGKKHSEKTKEKIGKAVSKTQSGSKNSQYGTCWITNEKENKKIHKGDLIPEGWRLGRKILKTNP